MNKLLFFFAALVLTAGCTKPPRVSVSGHVTGLNNATFLLTDATGATIAGDNIVNGSFKVDTILEHPGYGELQFSKNGAREKPRFEIYLEPGKYTIEADPAHLTNYPKITTTSAIQKDISAYQEIRDGIVINASLLVEQLRRKINAANPSNTTLAQYRVLSERMIQAEHAETLTQFKAYKEFTDRYPKSQISARLMRQLPYEDDPVAYNNIFQRLDPAAKESEEGKLLAEKLKRLIKLVPGADAPPIIGSTVDGKPFDKNKLNKKLYIVDFWRAGNQLGRKNHQDMIAQLLKDKHVKDFGLISISLDTKRDWWTTAIKDDHLTWPQYSDLKGDDSPNAENWMITRLPTYFVVDAQWRIVERDASFDNLSEVIDEYLRNYKEPSNGKNFSL